MIFYKIFQKTVRVYLICIHFQFTHRNNVNVEGSTHKQVVDLIKSGGDCLTLTVISVTQQVYNFNINKNTKDFYIFQIIFVHRKPKNLNHKKILAVTHTLIIQKNDLYPSVYLTIML